jgi:hypothetical protein
MKGLFFKHLFLIILFFSFSANSYSNLSSEESKPIRFTLNYKNKSIGYVDIINSQGGVLISTSKLLKLLHADFEINKNRTEGSLENSEFYIDTSKKQTSFSGKVYKYYNYETIYIDNDLYVDINLLSDFWPLILKPNFSEFSINLESDFALNELNAFLNSDPHGPPVKKKYTKKEVQQDYDIEIEKPEEFVGPIVVENSIEAFDANNINEENYLVFELRVDDLLYDELIDIYKHGNKYYVAIDQVAQAVDLAIEVQPDKMIVQGWYVKEENDFLLDLNIMQLKNKGETEKLSKQEVFLDGEEIFVSVENLNKWLPINFRIDYNSQTIKLTPKVLLPFQQKKEREIERERKFRQRYKKEYPEYKSPYKSVTWPVIDINTDSSISKSKSKDPDYSQTYSMISSGDLAYVNNHWFLSGNEDELTNLRIKFSKNDISDHIEGLDLTKFEFGDITSIKDDLAVNSAVGRGIYISNAPLSRTEAFDRKDFEGDILPDWEVELYRNDELIDFLIAGETGRYNFSNVAILYGKNIFKLVFYGPQGEIREKTEIIDVNSQIIPKGETYYSISYNQKDKYFSTIGSSDDATTDRTTLKLDHGLHDDIRLTYTSSYIELEESISNIQEKFYNSVDVITDFYGILTNLKAASDFSEGDFAFGVSLLSKVAEINVRAKSTYLGNFINESNIGDSDALELENLIEANGRISSAYVNNISYSFGLDHSYFASHKNRMQFSSRLTVNKQGVNVTNNLLANVETNDGQEYLRGDLSVRGKLLKGNLRGDVTYDLTPEANLKTAGISYQKKLKDKLTGRADVRENFFGGNSTEFSGFLNWDRNNYIVGTNMRLDTEGNYEASINLAFSLYKDPVSNKFKFTSNELSNSGAVSAFAYLDENFNNNFDEEEEILESAIIKRGNKKIDSEEGITFVDSLNANYPTDIVIDTASLDDPYWYPRNEGYSYLSRPGIIDKLPFPILITSEADGYVHYVKNGEEKEVSGLKIHLIDESGNKAAEVKSEYDGYFIFERIIPGKYFVIADEEELKSLKVTQKVSTKVDINEGGELFSDNNITLTDIN